MSRLKCCLLICFKSLLVKLCRPRSGSTMFASTITLVNNVSNYVQQMTQAVDLFRCIFAGVLKVNEIKIIIELLTSYFSIRCNLISLQTEMFVKFCLNNISKVISCVCM